uniref:Uncharacterized protein n=1 Tax=Glossina morsitans morsitans TaxID=37546 RepID=A0A1B0FPV4_GLOMM
MLSVVGNKTNINKENNVGEYATKLGDSARKRSVKKQPFNALQNVMHKQAFATPFKSVNIQNTAKLHSNVQCSQPRKKFGQHLTPTTKPQTSLSHAQISEMDLLLDSFDIDRRLEQIWSEMDLIDDARLNKLINGDIMRIDEEPENFSDYDASFTDDDEFNFSLTNFSNPRTNDEFDQLFKLEKPILCDDYDF